MYVVRERTDQIGYVKDTIFLVVDEATGKVVDSARTRHHALRIAEALNAGRPAPDRPNHEVWAGWS